MKLKNQLKAILFPGIVFSIFFGSFYGNFFSVGPSQEWYTFFQRDSDLIVEKTAVCKGVADYNGALIAQDFVSYMKVMEKNECNQTELRPYDSQFGLQARIVAFFAPYDDSGISSYIKKVEIVLSVFASILFTIFIVYLRKYFGLSVAATTTLFIALSPWLAAYANSTYWVLIFAYLPLFFVTLFYKQMKEKNLLIYFYVIIALMLYLKLLSGYEHYTTILVSVFIPIFIYESLKNTNFKLMSLWKHAVLVLGVGFIAFLAAITTSLVSLSAHYGSVGSAASKLSERASARSTGISDIYKSRVVSNFKTTLPETFAFIDRYIDLDKLEDGKGNSIKYALISILNYALLPAITFPITINGAAGELVQSIIAFSILGLISIRYLGRVKQYRKYYRTSYYSYWLSLLGSVSWLILMPAHAYPHAHLNAIVFYIPFLLICYMAIATALSTLVSKSYRS